MMAGGAELEALSHELAREMPDSEVAKELEAEASEVDRAADGAHVRAPATSSGSGVACGLRLDGPGARPRAGPGCRSTTRTRPLRPRLVAVADTDADAPSSTAVAALRVRRRARRLARAAWRATTSTWCACADPTSSTARSAVAAAEAGKHLWVEKPAGRNAADTAEIAAAVDAAGVQSAAGFNYRNAPAVELARELVARGRLGDGRDRRRAVRSPTTPPTPTARCRGGSTRATPAPACSATWPATASTWRRTSWASVGESPSWSPTRRRSSPSGRAPAGRVSHFARRGDGPRGPVEQRGLRLGAAALRLRRLARHRSSRRASAVGEQCTYGIEVRGTQGALAWDFRRMGELRVCLDQDYQDAAWATRVRRRRATASSPRSSPARASRWASTTSRSSRPRGSCESHRRRQAARRDHRRRADRGADSSTRSMRVGTTKRKWVRRCDESSG